MNSWSGPSETSAAKNLNGKPPAQLKGGYRCMVVDSGPIIKETNVAQWIGRADRFYTVPAVMQEIRDAKARHQLQQQWIPLLDLQVKEPSAQAMQRVIDFSKLTGDYPSLSAVDLQVLALVVDLEREGFLSLEHLRTTPKRTVGLGPITTLNKTSTSVKNEASTEGSAETNEVHEVEYDIVADEEDDTSSSCSESDEEPEDEANPEGESNLVSQTPVTPAPAPPSSWAKLVNPNEGSEVVKVDATVVGTTLANLALSSTKKDDAEDLGGQWDDAPEDVDPSSAPVAADIAKELESDFPSLAAAATVPYEGSDDEAEDDDHKTTGATTRVGFEDESVLKARLEEERRLEEEERERRKQEALKPISKSGKLYNSFRKYGHLMKPAPPKSAPKIATKLAAVAPEPSKEKSDAAVMIEQGQSRILGAAGASLAAASDEMKAEDDDGEGWITSSKDIRILKNQTGGGPLDPVKSSNLLLPEDGTNAGPLHSQRTACTTTDFAMQNVLLQMGLILLSIDGMQIRRLKSWVLRCGACFKIHTDSVDPNTGLRRLFCSHCGSDMMQRVSASVDAKTGRLKLHFSKKRQNKHTSARGTKYSLPKPGTGNRFQGDLLLREDQLLMGAWNQKVKKNGGGQSRAHAQSIFGKDIASNVGCQATALPNDIQVGFGRRNPNAAKGRERRGKKKKSSDRACGLRRY